MSSVASVLPAAREAGSPETAVRLATLYDARLFLGEAVDAPELGALRRPGLASGAVLHADEPSHSAPSVPAVSGAGAEDRVRARSRWESLTGRLTAGANCFFLPFSIPLILQNWATISPQTYAAVVPGFMQAFLQKVLEIAPQPLSTLAAIPWHGWSSGVLGNLFLLATALSLKDNKWAFVQGIGFATGYFVLSQIFYAGFMPSWAFWPLTGVVASFLLLGAAERVGKLPAALLARWKAVVHGAGWLATFLFLYAPLPPLFAMTPLLAAGIPPIKPILGMLGNLVMLPEALRSKNFMWFFGSTWGALVGGIGTLSGLWFFGRLSGPAFAAIAAGVALYSAWMLARTRDYFGLSSIREQSVLAYFGAASLRDLFLGKKS